MSVGFYDRIAAVLRRWAIGWFDEARVARICIVEHQHVNPRHGDELVEPNAARIRDAVARYEGEYERYARLAARVADVCRVEVIGANAIRGQVTFRAKSPRSLEEKLKRRCGESASMDEVVAKICDLAAVRIALYDADDEHSLLRALVKRFAGPNGCGEPLIERRSKHEQDPTNFYRATHVQAALRAADLNGSCANMSGVVCEIQVCSLMASVWNEIEHDLRYKHAPNVLSPAEYDLLSKLGHLTRSGDELVTRLLAATAARQHERQGAFEDVHDFVTRTRGAFPGVDFAVHAGYLFDALLELGLDSPAKLGPVDGESGMNETARESRLAAALDELRRFAAWLQTRHEARYELDEDSSDLLLVELLERYAVQLSSALPSEENAAHPTRVAWFAKRFLEYRSAFACST